MSAVLKDLETQLKAILASRDVEHVEEQPPEAPAEWTWDHIEISELGGLVTADRVKQYRQGCLNCYRNGGYVTAVADEGYRTLKECPDCSLLVRRIKRINRAMLPAKFSMRRFAWERVNIDGDNSAEAALSAWASTLIDIYRGNVNTAPSVAFCGPTGVGKSHAAFMLGRKLLEADVPVRWVNWIKLIENMRQSWRDDSKSSASDLWGSVFKIERGLIVIDDLGAGSATAYSRQVACDLFELCPNGVSLLITTNGVPDGKDEHGLDYLIGRRAASRMSGICASGSTMFTFRGQDMRRIGRPLC